MQTSHARGVQSLLEKIEHNNYKLHPYLLSCKKASSDMEKPMNRNLPDHAKEEARELQKEAPKFETIPVEGCMSSSSGGSRGGGRW